MKTRNSVTNDVCAVSAANNVPLLTLYAALEAMKSKKTLQDMGCHESSA